ncbi:DUF4264 domain-containing protein [Heliobacterium gestii]|uniref:Putative gamma-glutamylcyclotransferase n=1 Tax=Heliomicrobium gestii TaxID=2699 RepID=A0A845LHE3_HELGE|nr:DUF4264 family protein [Heliomicrobium gestii]MBM7867280.1 gamma-glutamylcyclotransferase (GGCT)/AIG2-like uncharacterized protein YtfP [Heliomicrobium gestii]MZP43835.1 DUF4264 domain-containing protein [Heliomicrobium gestii]
MVHRLFTYGTLTDRDTLEGLLEHSAGVARPAVLTGYQSCPSAYGYPYILPVSDGEVEGVVWSDLTDEDLLRTDEYEGVHDDRPMYFRKSIHLVIDGQPMDAWVYVGIPETFADGSNAFEPLATKEVPANVELFAVIDFLNDTLKDKGLLFGVRKNGETMTISIYEV